MTEHSIALDEARENRRRLDSCDGHDFHPITPGMYGTRYCCTHCKGTVDGLTAQWYDKGCVHGVAPGPFQAVRDFEAALCEYTGAHYAVTTNSCTMALLLACAWHKQAGYGGYEGNKLRIPSRTYVSVPQSIKHAGYGVLYEDYDWRGGYQLFPLPVWDSARLFTSGMYLPGHMQCVSFHTTKTLGDTQGGAILHDNAQANAWLRRARFDGRTEGMAPKDDHFDMLGWHCYMSPDVAARLLHRLAVLPRHNAPLPNDDYPDLSQWEVLR